MIPKRIELENFLSFGTPGAEIAFAEGEPLWVLAGPNGAGKSAVFDAITYALFGCHRGGANQGMEGLVRHGANGFRVVFEFGFGGTDYRITRTWDGKPTQRAEQRGGGGNWGIVPLAATKTALNTWAESLLGVNFKAFTASVLLRQGEADRILTETGTRRLELLKTIIGVERFERLSDRVRDAAKDAKGRLKVLCDDRDRLAPVTADDLAAAEAAFTAAAAARTAAAAAARTAADRVHVAKHWADLTAKRADLVRRLAEADARRADADRIRRDHARYVELSAVVPALGKLIPLRQSIVDADADLARLSAEQAAAEAERTRTAAAAEDARKKAAAHAAAADHHDRAAARLRERIGRDNEFLSLANEVADLAALLSQEADLPERVVQAADGVAAARERAAAVGEEKATAVALLKQAQTLRGDFDKVGEVCSECGQVVSAGHAEKERARRAAEADKLARRAEAADTAAMAAGEYLRAAEADHSGLADRLRQRDTLAARSAENQRTLNKFAATADPAAFRATLAGLVAEAGQHEVGRDTEAAKRTAADAEATRLGRDADRLARTVADLGPRLDAAGRSLAADRATADAETDRLPAGWLDRLSTITGADVDAFAGEHRRLAAAGVEAEFVQLQQDDALRADWAKRRDEADAALAAVPEESRVPPSDAEQAAATARAASAEADAGRDAAKSAFDELTTRAARHRALADDIRAAERRHELHARLDELLGKTGLQRELVRSAERGIVRYANETARNLSGGDLTIELAPHDPDATKEEAFDLQVRRAAVPAPTPVGFLSGSERFRVAVAVAVAIGRFAAGRAKPLRSVIIDEGFGSLDQVGLAAMAGELNRLKDCEGLERIVLVSHQTEFAEQFKARYELSPGEAGTTARAVRQ